MKIKDAIEEFHNNSSIYLEALLMYQGIQVFDNRNKGYCCPICGNGSGKSGDGIRLHERAKARGVYKCFSCKFYGDIPNMIGAIYNMPNSSAKDYIEQAKKACEVFGIPIEEDNN